MKKDSSDYKRVFEQGKQEVLHASRSFTQVDAGAVSASLTQEKAKELAQLQEILNELQGQVRALRERTSSHLLLFPTLRHLNRVLLEHSFTPAYRQYTLKNLSRRLTLTQLSDAQKLWELLQEQLQMDFIQPFLSSPEGEDSLEDPLPQTLHFFFGSPGSGKTGALIKLAAQRALEGHQEASFKVFLVNADNYRISSQVQWEAYANILNLPFSQAHPETLFALLKKHPSVQQFFIDTTGYQPHSLPQVFNFPWEKLQSHYNVKKHLVISANYKASDIRYMFDFFPDVVYHDDIVVTKCDHTQSFGAVLSFAWEKALRIAYWIDSRAIPQGVVPQSEKFMASYGKQLRGFSWSKKREDV